MIAYGERQYAPAALTVLLTWSAVVLAFLGGVRWGLETALPEPRWERLAGSVISPVAAWSLFLGRERLENCDLWVTLEPCAMCAGAIAHARIVRLYYGASDPKGGAVEHGPRFFGQPTCHHRPEVYPGIGEGEAGALLRDFFRDRR